MFDVELYLEDLLESLDRQTGIRAGYVPVVLVDDGSSDQTLDIAREWQTRTRYPVTIVEQENSGPGAARNSGIDRTDTPWITFIDADDMLSDGYVSEILDVIEAPGAEPSLIVTNIVRFLEATKELKNDHPLRYKFRDGTRTVRLANAPHYFQLSSSTSAFRVSVIRENDLRFDTDLMVFEDARFIGEYLLHFSDPTLTVLHRAQYLYRRRKDSSSLVPSAEQSAVRFVDVPERAYLHLINLAKDRLGEVPEWLQALIVYDLYWTMKLDVGMDAPARGQSAEVRATFVRLLRRIVQDISYDQILYARAQQLPASFRDALLALKGELDRPNQVLIDRLDPARRLMRARYVYALGEAPHEEFHWNGEAIEPTFGKRRGVRFFDNVVYMERILWLPAEMEFFMRLDGKRVTFYRGEIPAPVPVMHEWVSWRYFVPKWQRPSVHAGNHSIGSNLLGERKFGLRYPEGKMTRRSKMSTGKGVETIGQR